MVEFFQPTENDIDGRPSQFFRLNTMKQIVLNLVVGELIGRLLAIGGEAFYGLEVGSSGLWRNSLQIKVIGEIFSGIHFHSNISLLFAGRRDGNRIGDIVLKMMTGFLGQIWDLLK